MQPIPSTLALGITQNWAKSSYGLLPWRRYSEHFTATHGQQNTPRGEVQLPTVHWKRHFGSRGHCLLTTRQKQKTLTIKMCCRLVECLWSAPGFDRLCNILVGRS